MSNIKGPLISSQRYLDKAKVNDRAARFKRFIVSVYPIVLRGQQYTILMDVGLSEAGHKDRKEPEP